jgi:two-component system, OmpR family, response regulator
MDGATAAFRARASRDNAARILNVIDHPITRVTLTDFFQRHGMSVSSACGRHDMARHLCRNTVDLIIFDQRSRRGDAPELLRQMLSASIPVIITDDERCTAGDRVTALELGADDYVVEPISPHEMLARVRAVLRRRAGSAAAAPGAAARGGYRFAGLTLTLGARRLTSSDGTRIALSNREYDLLVAFLRAPGHPLSREHLLNATRKHADVADRSIDVAVLRLRRKFQNHGKARPIIQTRSGVGYALDVAVERFG